MSMRLTLLFFLFTPTLLFSQNEVDALRYSQLTFGGSARYMGLAGSMNAVGGDMSCAAVNPAGLGRFTKSEFGGSFFYGTANAQTFFNGTDTRDQRGTFNLSNIGIVGAFEGGKDSDWKMIQFGITYQKQAYFNNSFIVEGDNNSSLLDVFAYQANGINEVNLLDELPFTSGLAYWAYAIDPDTVTGTTYTTQIPGSQVHQIRSVLKKGNMGEIDITLSGNYMDKFYIGGTIGIPIVRYNEEYSHEEYVLDSSLALDNYVYKFNLITHGTGVNLKIGGIYLPVDWFRIGLALHTSSSIGLTDTWSSEISTRFRNGVGYTEESVPGLYNYRVKTPGKIIGSLGVIIGKWGLVSAEIESMDYTKSMLKPKVFESGSFSAENTTIKEIYTKALNFRFGSEWRIDKFSVRGGYALYGSPYKEGKSYSDNTRKIITAGIGFRNKDFYLDLTYVKSNWTEDYYLYDPTITNPASIKQSTSQVVLAAGVRF